MPLARIVHWSAGRASLEVARRFWLKGIDMADSVYRVTQVIGTSTESWAAAARVAVETAAKTVRDLRVAEVEKLDVTIEDGKITSYRAKLNISFKYETGT